MLYEGWFASADGSPGAQYARDEGLVITDPMSRPASLVCSFVFRQGVTGTEGESPGPAGATSDSQRGPEHVMIGHGKVGSSCNPE